MMKILTVTQFVFLFLIIFVVLGIVKNPIAIAILFVLNTLNFLCILLLNRNDRKKDVK